MKKIMLILAVAVAASVMFASSAEAGQLKKHKAAKPAKTHHQAKHHAKHQAKHVSKHHQA